MAFVKIDSTFLERADFSIMAKVIFSVLTDEARGGPRVSLGLRRLAGLIGCNVKPVRRAINELTKRGLIKVVDGKFGGRNTYCLTGETVSISATVSETPTVVKSATVSPKDLPDRPWSKALRFHQRTFQTDRGQKRYGSVVKSATLAWSKALHVQTQTQTIMARSLRLAPPRCSKTIHPGASALRREARRPSARQIPG